jgi:hypothetical protein
MADKIKAIFIIEMMGKPADYLVDTLKQFLDRFAGENSVKVINKKMNKAKPVEKTDLFSTFAEVEFEIDQLENLLRLVFAYMPSHIEIITPESLRMTNSDVNYIANELARRLHEYDAVAKNLVFQNQILGEKLKEAGVEFKETDDKIIMGNVKKKKIKKVKKKLKSR